MSFVLINNTTGPIVAVVLDDLGITVPTTGSLDITDMSPAEISMSAAPTGDLGIAIAAGDILVEDPRAGYSGNLTQANSLIAALAANDSHIGVQLASITDLDDVGGAPAAGEVLEYNIGNGQYEPVAASVIAGNIALGDLSDVDDGTAHTASTVYLFKGDGTNLDVIGFAGDADVIEAVEDMVGAMGIDGTDTTFTYIDGNGTIEWSVDDVFLRNTGDTLDSGVLTIASGASINVATGGDLTIVDAPVNPTDAANKEYVDSVAAGLDPKDAVIAATVGNDIGFTYNDTASGPTDGVGDTLTATVNGVTPLDGVTLSVGERVLIKDQTGVAGFADAAISGAPAGSTVTALGAGTYGFDVVIDGGSLQALSITTAGGGSEDYDAIAALMSTQVVGGSVAFVGGAFRVTSGSLGVSSTATVAAGTVGTDLFGAIDTADTVTTTFPASTVGTASLQNGIYSVTQTGDGSNPTILTRATDFDGSPANEVGEGNYVLVTQGTINGGSGWVVTGTPVISGGDIVVGVDPIAWTQFSESSSFTAGDGLNLAGSVFSLDINNMTAATIALGDEIAFNDITGPDVPRNTTVQDMFNDLNVPYGITGTGIMVQTADDTYTKVSIAVDGAGALDGLAVANADGTGGNPTIGLDVQNLPLLGEAIDQANDMLILWNPSTNANERVSVSSVVNAGAAPGYGIINADAGSSATATTVSEAITFSGDGITITAADGTPDTVAFNLDISDLTTIGAGTIALTDEFAIDDTTTTNKRATFTDLVTDLAIPNAIGAGVGYVVSDGSGTYTTRTIGVNAPGNLDGLAITGGDGTANTVIGLNIIGNALAGEDVAAGDLFIGYNLSGTANEAFTAQEMADGLFSLAGGLTNAYSSFVGGDGGTTAVAIGSDTITMNGTGINVTTTNGAAGLDTIDLALDINDLTLGAETLLVSDLIGVYDGTATLKYTFTDMVTDLQIPNAVGGGTGFLVSDGAGAYTTRTISASIDEDEDGLIVNTTDGTANLTIGLDIDGMTASAEDMAATDEFPVHNKSQGTLGANRSMTGQEIADGVATILSLPSGLAVTTIGSQEVLTLIDTTRTNKVLSVESTAITWSENRIGNSDWVQIGGANDALIGYIAPLKATIVKVSAHTTTGITALTKGVDLYVDDVLKAANIVLFPAGATEQEYTNVTLNIDVAAGEKIQLRGGSVNGSIQDTVITLWIKWDGTP